MERKNEIPEELFEEILKENNELRKELRQMLGQLLILFKLLPHTKVLDSLRRYVFKRYHKFELSERKPK